MKKQTVFLHLFFLAITATCFFACHSSPGDREFSHGIKAFENGNFVRAKDFFTKSINRRPGHIDNALTFNYIGLACQKLGRYTEAVDAFQESRRLNPEYADPVYNLGVVYYQDGKRDTALQFFQEASLIWDNDTRAQEYMIYILCMENEWQRARNIAQEALAHTPDAVRILNMLAVIELQLDNAQEAIDHLIQALNANSEFGPAIFNMAQINHNLIGNKDDARAYFESFVKLSSEEPQHTLALKLIDSLQDHQGAVVEDSAFLETTRNEPPATSSQKPPVQPFRTDTEPKSLYADAMDNARKASNRGDIAEAVALYLKAAAEARRKQQPENREKALRAAVRDCFDEAKAHYALGQFLMEKDRYEEALKAFKQAAVLGPDWQAAHLALAEAALQSDEYDAVLIALKKALSLEPRPDPLWTLASIYQSLGLNADATKAYEDFIEQFPDDARAIKAQDEISALKTAAEDVAATQSAQPQDAPETGSADEVEDKNLNLNKPLIRNRKAAVKAYNRGTIYQTRQEWQTAASHYRRAIENDPDFSLAYFNLGTVYRENGELELARQAYQEAIRIDPGMISARYNLALLNWELQRYDEAKGQAEEIIKINPQHANAHYLLGIIFSRRELTYTKARKHYENFIRLAPGTSAARNAERWINQHFN